MSHLKGSVYPESNYLVTIHLECKDCKDTCHSSERTDSVQTNHERNKISAWQTIPDHTPAPHIITTPKSCNRDVRQLLEKSFGIF